MFVERVDSERWSYGALCGRVETGRCIGARCGTEVQCVFKCVGLGCAVAEIVQAPFVLEVFQKAGVVEKIREDSVGDVGRYQERGDADAVAFEVVFFAVVIWGNCI